MKIFKTSIFLKKKDTRRNTGSLKVNREIFIHFEDFLFFERKKKLNRIIHLYKKLITNHYKYIKNFTLYYFYKSTTGLINLKSRFALF